MVLLSPSSLPLMSFSRLWGPRAQRHRETPPDVHLPSRLATWNPQIHSPLYSILPPEIRHLIFHFVFLPYQDTSTPGVPFDSAGYRPETAFPVIQAVALLRTCQLVYLETYTLPASLRTFVSWKLVWAPRCPYERSVGPRFHRIRKEDQSSARRLHIYAQQCRLEGVRSWSQTALDYDSIILPPNPLQSIGTHIRDLTITIRYTDFYWWENDQPLQMNSRVQYGAEWRAGFESFPNLETFTFELEMLYRRKQELDALANDVKRWRIALQDGRELSTDGQLLKHHTWMGSAQFSGAQSLPAGTIQQLYYVVTVSFKAGTKAVC
jgi:hypothetical protein